jgi:integrase
MQRQGKPVIVSKQTVEQYLEQWLRDTASMRVRVTTLENYRKCLVRVVPHLGRHQLKDLAVQHVAHCYAELAKTLSANTVRHTHTILNLALNDAEQWDLILKNPARRATLPGCAQRQLPPLTWDDLQRLLTALSGYRYFALYGLLLNTGIRKGEALALHWNEVDLDSGTLAIHHSLQKVRRDDVWSYEFLPPKTRASHRIVPLNRDMVTLLKQHQAKQEQERAKAGDEWHRNNLVFCTTMGKIIDPSNSTKTFQEALKAQGLPHYRLHDLRHGFATLLFQNGVNVKDVSTLLGHANVSITYDIYTHVLPPTQNKAVATLEGLVGS